MTFDGIDEALIGIIKKIVKEGETVSPRGAETREILGCRFRLTNPRARCVTLPSRKWNFSLAVGELCWHMAGSDSLEFISYYSKNWDSFSDDGVCIRGSCYGHKIFTRKPGFLSQWEKVKLELSNDVSSRRAVLSFLDCDEGPASMSKDVACITSIQFIVRSGRLHCINAMRSNDAIWGLCYDVFLVSMLQERLARELNLELGWYEHHATSMHVYKKHYEMAEAIMNESPPPFHSMSKMETVKSVPAFLNVEKLLREGSPTGLTKAPCLPPYWRELAAPLIELYKQRWGLGYRRQVLIDSARPAN